MGSGVQLQLIFDLFVKRNLQLENLPCIIKLIESKRILITGTPYHLRACCYALDKEY